MQIYSLTSGRHGTFLYNRQDEFVGRSLELYGEWSEAEILLFRQLIEPDCVVVEAGSNIGAHTVWFSRAVGDRGRVIAYEPQRSVFQLLCANLALNERFNVDARCEAIGRTDGLARCGRHLLLLGIRLIVTLPLLGLLNASFTFNKKVIGMVESEGVRLLRCSPRNGRVGVLKRNILGPRELSGSTAKYFAGHLNIEFKHRSQRPRFVVVATSSNRIGKVRKRAPRNNFAFVLEDRKKVHLWRARSESSSL